MARVTRPELVPFTELNELEKMTGKKMPKERYALIKEYFPSSVRLDWRKAFRDIDLFGRLLKDILERDQRELGDEKDPQKTRERLRQISGNDYSYEPFQQAFSTLVGSRSIRHVANRVDLSTQIVWKLKNGKKDPDLATLDQIAKAFGKDPSYFVEYRIAYVLGALSDQLELSPETSVDLYRKLRKQKP